MAASSNPMMGVHFINGGTKGWSEKFWLPDASYASAIANMNRLSKWRASLLPDDFRIVWSRVGYSDTARDSKAAITAPLLPTGDGTPGATTQGFGTVNITEDAVLFRFETPLGKWASRSIRGIPDQIITDDELQGTLVIPGTPPLVDPPAMGVLTWLSFLGNYLAYLLANTVKVTRTAVEPPNYDLIAWDRVLFRRSAIRRTGGPFDTSRGRKSLV